MLGSGNIVGAIGIGMSSDSSLKRKLASWPDSKVSCRFAPFGCGAPWAEVQRRIARTRGIFEHRLAPKSAWSPVANTPPWRSSIQRATIASSSSARRWASFSPVRAPKNQTWS